MLKNIKLFSLHCSKALGMFSLLESTRWRKNRLLIIAWHGISLEDEHLWDPELYMTSKLFRSRLDMLVARKCNVLTLNDALQRLDSGELPDNSVVLTFDDGFFDFYNQALPILKEYNFPATLYLTTRYTEFHRPVFDPVVSYLLWKALDKQLDMRAITDQNEVVDLASPVIRTQTTNKIIEYANINNFSIEERDVLVSKLANTLNLNYSELLSKRILQLMTQDEVKYISDQGIDVQLHTHHHQVPNNQGRFYREIEDNREAILKMIGHPTRHFCYPSGVYNEAFFTWLNELNITSAVTCEPDLASANTDKLLLPRLVDTSLLPAIAFEGWLSGVSSFLPKRRATFDAPDIVWGFAN